MSIQIHFASSLLSYVNNKKTVEVTGSTVGECLNQVVKQFPAIEKMLFAKKGKLLGHVGIYINGKDAYPKELTKLVKDGDELNILLVYAGG